MGNIKPSDEISVIIRIKVQIFLTYSELLMNPLWLDRPGSVKDLCIYWHFKVICVPVLLTTIALILKKVKSRINNKDMHVKMVWLKALFYYLTYLVQCLCSLNLLRNRLRPVLPDSCQKQIVKPWILPKNERMNSFLLLCDVFSFIFWKKLKSTKRHFEINRPL